MPLEPRRDHRAAIVEIESPRCRTLVREAAPGHVWFKLFGHLTEDSFEPLIGLLDRSLADAGSLTLLIDGEEITNYQSQYRERWTVWLKEHRKHIELHMLVRSPIVKMGLQLVSMAVGGRITGYSDPAVFAQLVRRCAPGFEPDAIASTMGRPVAK